MTQPWAAKTITWTSAAGDTIVLTDSANGYVSTTGRTGFGPVDAQVVSDTMWDGSALVRSHRLQPRVITVPLYILAPDTATYLARLRALQATLRHPPDPVTGLPVPGRITVHLPDGTQRSAPAYYQSGASPTEDQVDDVAAGLVALPNLQWYAPVPTWEGEEITRTWQLAAAPSGVPPMPPVLLGVSTVLGSAEITNPGDADAYPVWTITGPGTPVITNTGTGESYEFTTALSAGQTVTVDCRPTELAPATGLTATDNAGADWWPNFADYPDFWTLPPGVSSISLEMSGASSSSSVSVSASARWLSAW